MLIDNFQLFQAKEFFDSYTLENRIEFLGEDISKSLRTSMEKKFRDDILSSAKEKSEIVECFELNLMCKNNHSYSILRGMINKAIFDTFNDKTREL